VTILKKKTHIIFVFLFLSNCLLSQTKQYIDSVISVIHQSKQDTNQLIQLSIVAENGDAKIWPMYNNEMGKLAAKLQNSENSTIRLCAKRHLAASLNNKGYYFNERGIAYKAIWYFNMSLKIQREIKDSEGVAYSLSNLGTIYDSKGEIDKALEYYFSAVKIRENIGSKKSLAQSYNNIAILYNNQNDLDNALKYHLQSLKIRLSVKDEEGVALAYNNIGTTYTNLVENKLKNRQFIPDSLINKPLTYFKKSYSTYKKHDNEHGMALSMFNLADLYILKTDCFRFKNNIEHDTLLKKAEILLLKSLDIYTKNHEKEWIANVFNGLANVSYRQNKINNAKHYSKKAFELAKELGYPGTIQKSSEILRKVFESDKDYKNALLMSDLYHSMRDSITNDKTKKESMSKYFSYQNEKQQVLARAKHEKIEIAYQAKAKQQKTIIYFGIAGVILLTVFGLFIFNRFKITQRQNKIIQQQKHIVEQQKHIAEESRNEILDSINYAKRIQYSLLAHEDLLQKHLGNYFVLFQPKDIVSGDFYWATEHDNKFYLAVCDSTGHGVPGAFMSLLNIGFLSEAIKEKTIAEPNQILNYVRKRLIESINKDEQQDGMDGILLCFEYTDLSKSKFKSITYSAANNEPILIRNHTAIVLPKDKMPVGKGEKTEDFNLYTIDFEKNDVIYLYTDGYADQFGGAKGKKLKSKPLNELLTLNSDKDMQSQRHFFSEYFNNWKGNLEQVDDVCIIGIKL
jgi:serine phosphatase RsbU (regulator of sigma subunit)